MKTFLVAAFLAVTLATSHGLRMMQDGKEYVFETEAAASALTMDYASASAGFSYKMKTRVQVAGNTLNIKFEDVQFSQFVGMHDANAWPFDQTTFTAVDGGNSAFSVTLNEDGLFESMVVDSSADVFFRNIMRGWASTLQLNSGLIAQGKRGFKSSENTINGKCDITYTVADGSVRKSVSHTEDCENRVYRIIDDYRGFNCKTPGTKNGMGYPSSLANTVFITDKSSSGEYSIKAIIATSSFVAQFYEEEGSAQLVFSNSTSKLVDVKGSSGDISVSGTTITDLSYEWSDAEYKWNSDRDLQAKEPFFSSGEYFDESPVDVSNALKKGIAYQKTILESNGNKDADFLQKAHKYGINSIHPMMYALPYSELKAVADELFADKSDTGVMKANIFGELLGSAGTSASALVIRDLVMEGKFDNDRDAARALGAVPFHIRRPNTQLVKEFEKLLDAPDLGPFTKMSVPLTLGHLVRITCERAGPFMSAASLECVKDFASGYVSQWIQKFKSTTSLEDKHEALAVLGNIRWGGLAKALKPIIYGEEETDPALRSQAMWVASWEAVMSPEGKEYFMPIVADRSLDHEVRISALEMIFFAKPSSAQIANVLTILYGDKSYELINYAYTLLERYANSIGPCSQETADKAAYFLKYMRQWSGYETDWGFGVSKTYQRQFQKEKYGYGSTLLYYSVGSTQSTMPLSLGVALTNTFMGTYLQPVLGLHLRLEGASKALIRKFKKMDPSTWQTADLEKILTGDMNIRARPDQPVRVQITIQLKATTVFSRLYDEDSLQEGGKLNEFFQKFQGLGDTYTINHQRAVQLGGLIYEQPTATGVPLAILSSVTTMAHLTATVKRGNHRGMLYRDIDYDMHMFTQGNRIAMVHHPLRKVSFGIVNDRIYHKHFPRQIVVGVNPIKRELKVSVTRPPYDAPWVMLLHNQNVVLARGANLRGDYDGLQANCPSCQARQVITRGAENLKSRAFIDRTNTKLGSYLYGEYFDCELDIGRGNTVKNLLSAMAPYNKSPKNLLTSVIMGVRQIRTFFHYFPKTEQCGAMLRWSQSKENPVREIEIALRGSGEPNGERMFFRGRKVFIKALIKAKGEPADRSYRVNVAYDYTPGYLQNNLKIQINRAPLTALNISPYTLCLAYESEYPDFSKEFLGYDEASDMSVTGKALIQYGRVNQCSETDGEIRINFKHSTTQAARKELKDKWYYKKCMDLKNTNAWSGRNTVPVSEECFMTVFDATQARKYTWDVKFVKLSNRMKTIVANIQTAVKAGLLPYWDIDPEEDTNGDADDIGPFLNIEATFKNNEKNVDVTMETRQGEEEFNDVPLTFNWGSRLRNLKFTRTLRRLYQAKIINPCLTTSEYVRTMDNVTYEYEPSSCWTLSSAACGPSPVYAVFTKTGNGMPLAAKSYIGGHEVDMIPSGPGAIAVTVNGSPVDVADQSEYVHTKDGTEIFKIFRWGNTYNIYSFLKVWIAYDGHFVEVIPSPSTKGQHCGLCGNYNRNKMDEFVGRDMEQFTAAAEMVKDWEWKC